jgi:hypothetical protein
MASLPHAAAAPNADRGLADAGTVFVQVYYEAGILTTAERRHQSAITRTRDCSSRL